MKGTLITSPGHKINPLKNDAIGLKIKFNNTSCTQELYIAQEKIITPPAINL